MAKPIAYKNLRTGDLMDVGIGNDLIPPSNPNFAPVKEVLKGKMPIFQEHPTVLSQPENTHSAAGVPTQYAVDTKR